jgi:shikimate 5-dehydrogenase
MRPANSLRSSTIPSKGLKLGLIGFPLGHSLSPQIHAAALHALNLSGEYALYSIHPLPAQRHHPP